MSLLQFSRFFLYISVFAITIVLSSTFFPFIGGKYYFFRFMIELSTIFLLLSWAMEDVNRKYISGRFEHAVRQPLFIAFSLFVLAFLLASIFANDPQLAFWSNYERGEGGFQMIHYYGLFVLLMILMDSKEKWHTFFKVSLAASTVMILYGVGSAVMMNGFVGPYRDGAPEATDFWSRLFSVVRFQGSLGNPAYVAPNLLFAIFYAAWLWVSGKKNLLRNVGFSLLILFFLLFFALSQTRGAFLGLVAAIIAIILYVIASGSKKVRQTTSIIALVLVLSGSILYANKDNPNIQKIPGSRFLQISLNQDSAQTRFWTWGTAWRGFKDRPILGWGPENFSTVFDRHFDTRHYVPGRNTETWFDRAHSILFDYLAETGLLGLLSYLGVFAIFYWQFYKSFWVRPQHSDSKEISETHYGVHESELLRGLLLAIPIAYLVQGLVLFDVLPIFINWVAVVAFASAVFKEKHEHGRA